MPDIWTLSPEALRGYALGLRSTTANLGEAWAKTGMVPDDEMSIIISITRDAWQREAAIAEGFAGRLDAPEAKPQPVTPERVAAWAARFEAAAHREIPHQRWYRPHGKVFSYATLREAFDNSPEVQPAAIESSEWEGTRWAIRAGDGTDEIIVADTREEAVAYAAESLTDGQIVAAAQNAKRDFLAAHPELQAATRAEPTQEEAAQAGLADAVAESLATPAPAPSAEASVNTPATDTADALLTARREKAHALFLAGMKPSQIAAQIGIPEGSINAWASTRGWRKELAALKASEAQAAAPAPTRPMRSDSPWTEARLALLARLMPTVMHLDAIAAALNELPGLPIATSEAVRIKARKLDIHRRGEAIPEEFATAPASRTREPQKAEVPRHAHTRAENGNKPDTWTDERNGLLRRLYPSTRPVEEILDEVNLLPGPAVASLGAVMAQAKKLGLTRAQPPRLDAAIAPPRGTEPPPMTTEDKAEARERLRTGKSKGARDIVEYFGCTDAEALEIVDAHRARMGKAA